MTFQEAAKTVLTQKYADFHGRAERSEFWWFALFEVLVLCVCLAIDAIVDKHTILYALACLGFLLPSLSLTVRRLHDTNHSGWWYLLVFVPLGGFLILYWCVIAGTPGPNQFGEQPSGVAALA